MARRTEQQIVELVVEADGVLGRDTSKVMIYFPPGTLRLRWQVDCISNLSSSLGLLPTTLQIGPIIVEFPPPHGTKVFVLVKSVLAGQLEGALRYTLSGGPARAFLSFIFRHSRRNLRVSYLCFLRLQASVDVASNS